MRHERGISRREFITGLAASLLVPSLACRTPSAPQVEIIPTPTKEKENVPKEGDVVIDQHGMFNLLRNGSRYVLNSAEFTEYRRRTKFDKYKRRIFSFSPGVLDSYPIGFVPQEKYVIDPFSGQLIPNKPLGGEINIYFSGFLSDGGMPYELLIPKQDAFTTLRKKLEQNGWSDNESLYFNYGKEKFDEYTPSDTAKNPEENIAYALKQIEQLKKEFPLVQFNLIANSLGCLFALEVAKKHADAINNIILFSGPVRGLRHEFCRAQFITPMREVLRRLGIIEQVTDYLHNLWEDKAYQRELDEFVESFKKSGKNIRMYASDADSIVFSEESYLPGVTTVIEAGEKKGCVQRIISLIEILEALKEYAQTHEDLDIEKILKFLKEHARTHEDPENQQETIEMIGENLAKEIANLIGENLALAA